MKKAVLIICIVALIVTLSLCFTSCNRTASTQSQLANLLSDHSFEQFVYDVYAIDSEGNEVCMPNQNDTTHGTYTVTLQAYTDGSKLTTFGKQNFFDLTLQKGVLITSTLVTSSVRYDSGCYYTLVNGANYMVPAYTYRWMRNIAADNEDVDYHETFYMFGRYDGTTLHYERYIDCGEKETGNIVSKSTTMFDNSQFQQSLRCVTTFSTNFSFSFATPIVSRDEATLATLTATISSTSYAVTDFSRNSADADFQEKGIPCYKTRLSRSTQVAGVAQTLYYSSKDIKINGWALQNVLVKIEEPFKVDGMFYNMVYALSSATIA